MKTFLGLMPLSFSFVLCFKAINYAGASIYVISANGAMSRETRGKKMVYIQDGRANFVKLIPLSKNLNYYQEDLIDSEVPKSRKINGQTLSKGVWKTLLFQAIG